MIKYDTENKGKTFMKKIYTILLVVAIMLVFLVVTTHGWKEKIKTVDSAGNGYTVNAALAYADVRVAAEYRRL